MCFFFRPASAYGCRRLRDVNPQRRCVLKNQLLPTDPLPQTQPIPARELSPTKKSPLAFVPRLAGYALMAFIGWLLLTTLFEPWVSTSATRAVLNAPAVLITTPISGTVTAQYAQNGQAIQPGQPVATVKNTTVARDALTTLLTQRLELQGHLDDLRSHLQADQRMLDYTNGQYKKYQQASVSQLQSTYESIQAQQDATSAKLEELDAKYARAMALERDGAISAAAVEQARSEADAAQRTPGRREACGELRPRRWSVRLLGRGRVEREARDRRYRGSVRPGPQRAAVAGREPERVAVDAAAQLTQVTQVGDANELADLHESSRKVGPKWLTRRASRSPKPTSR